jgi:methylamine dehydrogenase accessory protein MauD
MNKPEHYILFDSGCAQCSDVAEEIENASDHKLRGKSLYAPEAKQWLDRARPGWKFEPTLVEVDGDHVRAYTGMAMRAHMVTFLNPVQLLKIARVVQKAGIPLFGAFEAHAPNPSGDGHAVAEAAETTAAANVSPAETELPSGFAYTNAGPALGTLTPIELLTTITGKEISLTRARERNLILLFLSTSCGFCRQVAESLNEFAHDAPEDLVLVFGVTEPDKLREFVKEFHLASLPIVVSPETRSAFSVVGVPYGFALDTQGIVRGKGIVNNNEHLDSLANTFYVSVDAFKQALDSRKEERVVVS